MRTLLPQDKPPKGSEGLFKKALNYQFSLSCFPPPSSTYHLPPCAYHAKPLALDSAKNDQPSLCLRPALECSPAKFILFLKNWLSCCFPCEMFTSVPWAPSLRSLCLLGFYGDEFPRLLQAYHALLLFICLSAACLHGSCLTYFVSRAFSIVPNTPLAFSK